MPSGVGIPMKYKEYTIFYNPKPIPTVLYDYNFCHEDYDGEGDPRCGTAASTADAMQQINEIEEWINENNG